jgi:UPF0271 protein
MGDGALRWRRDPSRDPRALLDALRAHPRVVDAVVTEEHALVAFDPEAPPDAPWQVESRVACVSDDAAVREHVIRARYDGADLEELGAQLAMSPGAVASLHAAPAYVVRFLGFLPGFAYLGSVDPRLVVPRRATPRARVEAGVIGIAAAYTGVYPFASPGGWHLVGHAVDFRAFDRERGALLALGDRVRFEVVA